MRRVSRTIVIWVSILLGVAPLASACSAVGRDDAVAGRHVSPVATTQASPATGAARQQGIPAGGWHPQLSTTWQWQLTGLPLERTVDAQMYDVDLFDTDAELVETLHAQGRKVVCYLSAGSWEEWRPDAGRFPTSIIGREYAGWPGEKWLDIRQIDGLAPILRARLDQCQAKGFDGVEPDNVDGYLADTGFPLSFDDQLRFNRWLSAEAHARGLSIGLKNDGEQAPDLVSDFDWALTEDCLAEAWCAQMAPFVAAGKAVFAGEYTDTMTPARFLDVTCPQAEAMHLSAILKNRDLDAWRATCP